MCEECSVDTMVDLIVTLHEAVAALDTEHEYAAAALVAQAIGILEGRSQRKD